jgi:hypothetical protein
MWQGDAVRPALLWPGFVVGLWSPDVPVRQVGEIGLWLLMFSAEFALPSALLGWVAQCVVVMLRHRSESAK